MAKQDKPTSEGKQEGRGILWRVLIIGALLVTILVVAALRSFGSPSASPLPVRIQASPSPARVPAHLETVADIPLPGGASRFDYQSLDPHRGLLFISHLGASTVTVFDLASRSIRANIAHIADVHGVLAIPELGRVYASAPGKNQGVAIDPTTDRVIARYALPNCDHDHSLLIDALSRLAFVACDGNSVLLTVDLRSMTVTVVQTVGDTPDVLALDSGWHLLYVASETGMLSVFEESGQALRKLYEGLVATEAHSVAVDQQTHRIFLPLQEVHGKPLLRIAIVCPPSHPPPARHGSGGPCYACAGTEHEETSP